jgi:hypothetical protein
MIAASGEPASQIRERLRGFAGARRHACARPMSAERNFVLRLGSSTSSEPHFRPQDGGGGARRVEIDVRRARNVVGPSVALVGVAVTIAIYGVVGVIV